MKTKSKNLSKRERDVVELLLQGKSNEQIAAALGIMSVIIGGLAGLMTSVLYSFWFRRAKPTFSV